MDELCVVWNGSFKDVYLCIPPYRASDLSHVPQAVLPPSAQLGRRHHTRTLERAIILKLLATRPEWPVAELRAACRLSSPIFGGVLNRLVEHGRVERRWFGRVALPGRQP